MDSRSPIEMQQALFQMDQHYMTIEQSLEYVGDNSKYQKQLLRVFSTIWLFISTLTIQLPVLFPHHYYSLSLYFIGQCLAGLIVPHLADTIGRKTILVYLLMVSSLLIPILTKQGPFFTTVLFLIGLLVGGFENVSYVYLNEISATRFRNLSINVLNASWSISQILFAICLHFQHSIQNILIFFISLPMFISACLLNYYLYESVKYLVNKRAFEQAKRILRQIQKYNKRPYFNFSLYEEFQQSDQQQQQQQTLAQKILNSVYSYNGLFASFKGNVNLIVLMYLWFIRYYFYFGIQFSLNYLHSIQMSIVLMAITEILGSIVSFPIKLKMARKKSLFIFLLIMTVSSFLLMLLDIDTYCQSTSVLCNQELLQIIYTVIFKFSLSVFIDILVTFTHETVELDQSSKLVGLCMSFGKSGCIVVPLYFQGMNGISQNPLNYVWIMCLLSLLALYFIDHSKKNSKTNHIELQTINYS